ncbi:hypothetical protein Q5P01_022972 [Channa striata]|uniref:Uncharacterized protein n=1 Tax=Channa striata TaxID=64152 RepID=A0AA88RWN1_CHASR|nr:hypothetical protein Q5P01_022972 [Channa striata]
MAAVQLSGFLLAKKKKQKKKKFELKLHQTGLIVQLDSSGEMPESRNLLLVQFLAQKGRRFRGVVNLISTRKDPQEHEQVL